MSDKSDTPLADRIASLTDLPLLAKERPQLVTAIQFAAEDVATLERRVTIPEALVPKDDRTMLVIEFNRGEHVATFGNDSGATFSRANTLPAALAELDRKVKQCTDGHGIQK